MPAADPRLKEVPEDRAFDSSNIGEKGLGHLSRTDNSYPFQP